MNEDIGSGNDLAKGLLEPAHERVRLLERTLPTDHDVHVDALLRSCPARSESMVVEDLGTLALQDALDLLSFGILELPVGWAVKTGRTCHRIQAAITSENAGSIHVAPVRY